MSAVTLPSNLKIIRESAFSGCRSLKTITIPAKVEYIYQKAFAGCTSLESVKCLATTPPFLYENAFSNYEIPLTVSEGCRDTYAETAPWNKFKEILSGADTKYTLTYMVDGEVYATYELLEGAIITPEPEPTKDGYVFSGWSEIPATMPAENVTITGSWISLSEYDQITMNANGKITYCSSYDLDFTNVEGIRAYVATGYDDDTHVVWLTRVYKVPASTGLLLKGEASVTCYVPHATARAYYANMLVGNTGDPITIGSTDGDMVNYIMSGGQFRPIASDATTTISKNKAYLQLPARVFAGTRTITLGYDDGDGTTYIEHAEISPIEDNVYYNLQGQRVENPTKGIYIRNGKKVIVR